MSADTRRLITEALPPLTLPRLVACRPCRTNPMPRLKRIVCLLAALALPALGITVADTVHRTGETKASQAAAPVIPSDGAAAHPRAVTPARALRTEKTAAAGRLIQEARS